MHYLIAERSAGYYAFWTQKVFGRFNTRTDKINPWTRYRLSRAIKWIVFFIVLSIVLGVIFDVSPASRSSRSRSGSPTRCRSCSS